MSTEEIEPAPADLLEMDLDAGRDDWQPTPHGHLLSRALVEHDLVRGRDVLELGSGVANHTILLLRRGARSVVATEITPERLATTRANVERNVPGATHIEYRVSDWLATSGRFDAIVTNPPFAKSGKRNRRYFIDSLILDAHKRLRPGGRLVFVQSSMADLGRTRAELERNGFDHEIVEESRGPFRDYYFDDPTFLAESAKVPQGFEHAGGTYYERLFVVVAVLRPWTPPYGAH